MKPLPAEGSPIERKLPAATLVAGRPPSVPPSSTNRKVKPPASQRAYPWLLLLSTCVAGTFCYLYITKPVIQASNGSPAPLVSLDGHPPAASPASAPGASLAETKKSSTPPSVTPAADHLPGDATAGPSRPASADPRTAGLAKSGPGAAFEETNLRVQHVLTAETPGGEASRIVLDVPVLYRSRSLRWSKEDLGQARELLVRLADYQERTRALRAEGVALLDSWNHLIGRSIPGAGLRADSPSLPANQEEASTAPRPASLNTSESIQIQPAGK